MTQMSGIIIAVLHKNHIWSYDFVQDRLANGKKIRILTVIDEYTRKCLKLKVGYSLKSDAILESLADLFFTEGIPEYIRSDNGSEFVAKSVQDFLQQLQVTTHLLCLPRKIKIF